MSNPFEIPVGDEQLAGTGPFTYRDLFDVLTLSLGNEAVMNQPVTVRQSNDEYAGVQTCWITNGDPNDCVPAGHLILDAFAEVKGDAYPPEHVYFNNEAQ